MRGLTLGSTLKVLWRDPSSGSPRETRCYYATVKEEVNSKRRGQYWLLACRDSGVDVKPATFHICHLPPQRDVQILNLEQSSIPTFLRQAEERSGDVSLIPKPQQAVSQEERQRVKSQVAPPASISATSVSFQPFEEFETMIPVWTGEDEMTKAFQAGHCIPMLPAVAQLTGSDLVRILKAPQAMPPQWALTALADTTRKTHRRMLTAIASLPPDLLSVKLTAALSEMMSRKRMEKRWTWATTLRNLCSIQGALALLPMYRQVPHGLPLKLDSIWQQTLQAIQRKAKEEIPRVPTAMTPDLFERTLALETRVQHRVVLQLMFFTSARVGCVLLLQKEDITFHSDTSISVRFQRGKGVKLRGPYTVHGPPLHEHAEEIRNYVTSSPQRLFTIKSAAMLSTFRLFDTTMEARSVRRGSLQAMAHNNIPLEVIQHYSGHTNEKTLLRYLGWGVSAGHRRQQMSAAGTVLVPRRH